MFRYYRALIILFSLMLASNGISAEHGYQKPGAAVSLSPNVIYIDNNTVDLNISLLFNQTGEASISLTTEGLNLVSEQQFNRTISTNHSIVSVPVSILSSNDSENYINIFVTITNDNASTVSRALSLKVISGTPVKRAKSTQANNGIISMQAVETIKYN